MTTTPEVVTPVLPKFTYYGASAMEGVFQQSSVVCRSCNKSRGYIYDPMGMFENSNDGDDGDGDDADDDAEDNVPVCPWCIQNGDGYKNTGMIFNEADCFCGHDDNDNDDETTTVSLLPKQVQDELSQRTPGFQAWQESQWWIHCNDGCIYLGKPTKIELETKYGEQALSYFRELYRKEFNEESNNNNTLDDDGWDTFFESLGPENDTTAYIFQCRKCHKYGGFIDMN